MARSGARTFKATLRPRNVSSAAHTLAIPPSPIRRSTRRSESTCCPTIKDMSLIDPQPAWRDWKVENSPAPAGRHVSLRFARLSRLGRPRVVRLMRRTRHPLVELPLRFVFQDPVALLNLADEHILLRAKVRQILVGELCPL